VLGRVTGPRAKVAARLREELHSASPDQLTGRMTAELFELAAARPITFDADAPDAGGAVRRIVPVERPVQPALDPAPVGGMAWAERVLAVGPASIVRDVARERWAGWPVRRRRALIASGAAGLTLIGAIVVVPGPASTQVPAAAPTASQAEPGTATAEAPSGEEPEIAGDDPIAALHALAARRDRCLAELSVLCLDGVDEVGSSAFDADRAAIRGVLEGGVAPARLQLASVSLVERLGDSALIDLGTGSDPASVLLLKSEAGWRIRDYLAAPSGGPG
jgi:eukaryotic-like serine/threonine-protein kinase